MATKFADICAKYQFIEIVCLSECSQLLHLTCDPINWVPQSFPQGWRWVEHEIHHLMSI